MGNKNNKQAPGTLSEDEIELLMANTNMNRFDILQWFDGFIKDCPNGKLNKDQFRKTYQQIYPSGDPAAFSDLVFNTFDSDDNKFISFPEFLLAISALSDGDVDKRLHLTVSLTLLLFCPRVLSNFYSL
jgi:Ca2+-binding EF-hand superfamily protein